MRTFATLFDSKYLVKGMLLLESIYAHCADPPTVVVLSLDDRVTEVVQKFTPIPVGIVTLADFERETGIDEVRAPRTHQEYCWTLASALSWYLLASCDFRDVTYLDADLWFFADPEIMFDEIGMRSIGIVPHRFPPDRKHMESNGKFNVGSVTFRATGAGFDCARSWARQCREWCYYRAEDGKFADQKYLDAWPERHGDECAIIEHPGVGLAPWNVNQYSLRLTGTELLINDKYPLVYYHMHEFQELGDGTTRLTNYSLQADAIKYIYKPYVEAYREMKRRIGEFV